MLFLQYRFTFLPLLSLNVIDELSTGLTVNVTFSPVRSVSVVEYRYAKYYVTDAASF